MNACLYCETPNDLNLNFCINCDKQIKCISCERYLIKEKEKCYFCGVILGLASSSSNPANTFFLEEKQVSATETYSKRINVSVNNEAVDKVAA